MPNWCEGSIKVRGEKSKVLNFFENGINRYGFDAKKMEHYILPKNVCLQVTEYKDGCIEVNVNDAYIEGTRRAFIDDLYAYFTKEENEVCAVGQFRQAWSIDPDSFQELADKWGVDFRLFGTDCGMGFTQEVIAIKGEEVINHVEDYASYGDFLWDSPFPYMGG